MLRRMYAISLHRCDLFIYGGSKGQMYSFVREISRSLVIYFWPQVLLCKRDYRILVCYCSSLEAWKSFLLIGLGFLLRLLLI